MRNADRMSRLSGECPRVAEYTKSKSATGFLRGGTAGLPVPGGGFFPSGPSGPSGGGFFSPFVPQPADPRSAPLPFKPLNNKTANAFGKRGLPLSPLGLPASPKNIGGLAAKGMRLIGGRIPVVAFGFGVVDFVVGNNQPGNIVFDMPRHGFTLVCRADPVGGYTYIPGVKYSGPDTRLNHGTADPNLPCTLTLQTIDANLENATPDSFPATTRWVAFGPSNQSVAADRMQLREQWSRPTAVGTQINGYAPPGFPRRRIAPQTPHLRWPAVDPFHLPIGGGVPTPRPIPFAVIPHRGPNGGRDPVEQPGGGQPTTPVPSRPVRPGTSIPVPSIVITPPNMPGTAPVGSPKPPIRVNPRGRHVRRAPNKKEREKKHNPMSRGAFQVINGLIGLATESLDLLGAFFDSLPKHIRDQYRWKGTTPLDRLAFVLENLEHVKVGDLVANIVSMLIEDYAYGRLGAVGAKANQLLHQNFGIDLRGRLPKPYHNEVPSGAKSGWVDQLDGWLDDNVYDPVFGE